MRVSASLQLVFVGVLWATSGSPVLGQDNNSSGQLIQARFDRLVPTSSPTVKPKFDKLRPTTEPLIHPSLPVVHITENVAQSFSRPLLITTE